MGEDGGFGFNEKKTQVMTETRSGRRQTETLNFGSFQVEGVSAFTYLGRYLTTNNGGIEEVQCRISAAKTADFSLVPLLKTKDVSHENRATIYKALIRPIVVYGSDTWTLSHSAAQMINYNLSFGEYMDQYKLMAWRTVQIALTRVCQPTGRDPNLGRGLLWMSHENYFHDGFTPNMFNILLNH